MYISKVTIYKQETQKCISLGNTCISSTLKKSMYFKGEQIVFLFVFYGEYYVSVQN